MADVLAPRILARLTEASPWKMNAFFPSPDAIGSSDALPFMASSACVATDFFHTDYRRWCDAFGEGPHFHRKQWEWVFILHHAARLGVVGPGRSGLAFGVGRELLPAAFASLGCDVTATDAPAELAHKSGWDRSGQFAPGLAALPQGRLDRIAFEERVAWRPCDMNAIDPALSGYDFCWSSCALEHLGSLQAGLDFIVNSVEHTLKPGGVALHTTEFNLTSNGATVTDGDTVFYRRCDLEQLIATLRGRGHEVDDLVIGPNVYVMNGFADTAPFTAPHLLVNNMGYTVTSIGLVIRRGP
ncbi:MAG TPA: hypothetical protein VGI95_03030 [Caulobacteraceae bacterium]